MLRISKLTDYSVVLLAQMAGSQDVIHTAGGLAAATGVAVPTVSKILKLLNRGGVVQSTRGAKGGYKLSRAPSETTIASVILALEGPIALTECEIEHGGCDQSSSCHARNSWGVINRAVRGALESVTLADMIQPTTPRPAEVTIPISQLRPSRYTHEST